LFYQEVQCCVATAEDNAYLFFNDELKFGLKNRIVFWWRICGSVMPIVLAMYPLTVSGFIFYLNTTG